MIKIKTISGHYDTVYDLAHNNREFTPRNVDVTRTPWNYNCVASGEEAYLDIEDPCHISEFWERYRELNKIYWQNQSIANTLAYERYQEQLRYMRRFSRAVFRFPHNPLEAMIRLFLLPLLIPCGIFLTQQQQRAKAEWEQFQDEQWLQHMYYNATKVSLRSALYAHDHVKGTAYLHSMDTIVSEMAQRAETYAATAKSIVTDPKHPIKYATLEEIYDKLYEPSFQDFQQKQRPCRRYNGTYLEQIREGQHTQAKKKKQSKNVRSRKTAEAIEIVFGIGDMDNTGYALAFQDAKQSEELMKDFCDHLMENPHLCCITTKELNDPKWEPPFQHGLIVLNLTMHADEATPGVHLTCIPYSRNCSRGPKVQASLGRAMTGMGYPSTWVDVLDENGERIPKRNKDNEIIYNKDGSIRYQQKPDKQGIIDWVEEQKAWIQQEMKRRYDWDREYKGSHPRGNLSTPDYQAARAKERQEEYDNLLRASLSQYEDRVEALSLSLDRKIDDCFQNSDNQSLIEQYLRICTDEEYEEVVQKAATFLDKLAISESENHRSKLNTQIQAANEKMANRSESIQGLISER